jgi:hypothetical protein
MLSVWAFDCDEAHLKWVEAPAPGIWTMRKEPSLRTQ